jgi:hypothetical protein
MPTLPPHIYMGVKDFFLGVNQWEREGRGVYHGSFPKFVGTEETKPSRKKVQVSRLCVSHLFIKHLRIAISAYRKHLVRRPCVPNPSTGGEPLHRHPVGSVQPSLRTLDDRTVCSRSWLNPTLHKFWEELISLPALYRKVTP